MALFQIACVGTGLWLSLRRPAFHLPAFLRRLASVALAAGVLFGAYGHLMAWRVIDPDRKLVEAARVLNESEELILTLTPSLAGLDKSVMNLELPNHQSHDLFENRVSVVDLAQQAAEGYSASFRGAGVGIRAWPIAERERSASLDELRLWRPLLERVEYFEHAHFKIKEGHFLDDARDEYEMALLFAGVPRFESGQLVEVRAKQTVRWRRQPVPSGRTGRGKEQDEASMWRIYAWRSDSLSLTETDRPLFAEVLDEALVEPQALARARASSQERLVVEYLRDTANFRWPHKLWSIPADDQHPGISVVDLDRDGFDDLYVMDRFGQNLLFRNRGDGRFEEIAARVGLDVKDHTTSAIFADFDNDGDLDAFLGRTLARSAYLVNERGRFVDRSEELADRPLPYFVASVSAVDYDRDGLLDLYLSTYQSRLGRRRGAGLYQDMGRRGGAAPEDYLAPEDAKRLTELMRSRDSHPSLNRFGPPNVLLKNVGGGRFEAVRDTPLHVFRDTFQASWGDLDDDGDDDVYLANDAGPQNLFRNDGQGRFVEVTSQMGTREFGFGMGVSWGDYDLDGRLDLYVTDMYSKAGRRITAQLPGLDPRYAQGAVGNALYHNASKRFEKVSGSAPPELMVEEGGWGWGSQFVDVDNDAFPDIYAPSGYYSAPKEVAKPLDL